eukprot:EG_transcript_11623
MPKEVTAALLLHDSSSDVYLVYHTTQSAASDLEDRCWTIPKAPVEGEQSPQDVVLEELLAITGVGAAEFRSDPSLAGPFLTLPNKKRTLLVFRLSQDRLSSRFPAEELRCAKTIAPPSPLQGRPEADGYRWVGREEGGRLVAPGVKAAFDGPADPSPPASPISAPNGQRKILLLHGWGQCAAVFEKKTKVLKKKLEKAGLEVVYAQAPHSVPGFTEEDADPRGWWYYDEADRGDFSSVWGKDGGLPFQVASAPFFGLTDTLADLAQLWRTAGPFEGILGFSQGAGMASMVAKRAESDPAFQSLRYAILFSAFWLAADGEDWYSGDIALPALHVIGATDTLVPEAVNRQLAVRYPAGEVVVHPGGHNVPQTAEYVTKYLAFIDRCVAAPAALR